MLTNQKTGQDPSHPLQYYFTWLVSAVAGGGDADQSEDRTAASHQPLKNNIFSLQIKTHLWDFFHRFEHVSKFLSFPYFLSFFYISVVSTLLSFPHGVNWRQLRKKIINTMFVQFVVSYSTLHL